MPDLRLALRRSGQAALCVSALAGGAAAHGLQPADPPVAREPISQTIHATLAPIPLERPPHRLQLDPIVFEAPPAPVEPPSAGPFAERLRDGMVMTGRTPHRLILFTFDDGPDPRNTPRLLDQLDAVGIKAVFFLTASRMSGAGSWVRTNQAIARDIVRRGHVVGNHTLDHAQLPMLDNAGVLAQVREADAIFEQVLGERTWLVRPPGGARSPRVDAQLATLGHTQMLWNLGTGDFQVRTADEVVQTFRRILERREREGERGGIVLMHDTHSWSVDAFPQIVSWLRERNCELEAQGEELYDVVDDPSLFFAARRDASPSRQAPMARPDPAVIEARQARLQRSTRERCRRLAHR